MKFEAKMLFVLAILSGTGAVIRSTGNMPAFLTALCVAYLAAATAISLHQLIGLVGDRPCR